MIGKQKLIAILKRSNIYMNRDYDTDYGKEKAEQGKGDRECEGRGSR